MKATKLLGDAVGFSFFSCTLSPVGSLPLCRTQSHQLSKQHVDLPLQDVLDHIIGFDLFTDGLEEEENSSFSTVFWVSQLLAVLASGPQGPLFTLLPWNSLLLDFP